MPDLSLAQLLAMLQDNLQRSYDYVEDLAALDRQNGEQSVVLSVHEMEIDLPVSVQLVESTEDIGQMIAATEAMSAYQIAKLRVDMPSAPPELRAALREQTWLAAAQGELARAKTVAEQNEGQDTPARPSKPKPSTPAVAADNAQAQAIAERASAVRSAAVAQARRFPGKTKDLRLQFLGADRKGAAEPAFTATIRVRFKASLK